MKCQNCGKEGAQEMNAHLSMTNRKESKFIKRVVCNFECAIALVKKEGKNTPPAKSKWGN